MRKKVIVLPGDDASAEATLACMSVLRALDLPIDWRVVEAGVSLGERELDTADSVLFGASNGTTGGLRYLRMGWGTYANVRPIKMRPGIRSSLRAADNIDYIIVREALEDVYAGIEGDMSALRASGLALHSITEQTGIALKYPLGASADGRYGLKLYTRAGVERVAHFAARLALQRKATGHAGKVTIGGKWNVNPQTDGFFRDVAREVICSYDGLTCNAYLADDFGRRLVMSPAEFDVVLLPNLYGDILSDVGAATVGGLGMAPSGSYGETRAYFEPIHGSAPDLLGRHVINPVATILSAAMMLDYLGFRDAAAAIDKAVDDVLRDGRELTPDLGGSGTTEALADAVREAMRA